VTVPLDRGKVDTRAHSDHFVVNPAAGGRHRAGKVHRRCRRQQTKLTCSPTAKQDWDRTAWVTAIKQTAGNQNLVIQLKMYRMKP
jgi:hypothetical protein